MQQPEKRGFEAVLRGAARRILADFRAFRWSWSGFWRWSGITFAALAVGAITALYFLDWNKMRGPIGRYASARYGREVRLDGDLTVNLFTFQPRISLEGLFIGNPSWVGVRQAAEIPRAVIELRLLPLLFGDLILPSVEIDRPQILLVRDANGRSNWSRSAAGPGASWALPPIRNFAVTDGHVEVRDAVRKLNFLGAVSSRENEAAAGRGFALTGAGTLNGKPFRATVQGGPLLNIDETRPYHFTADIVAGETHAMLDGRITRPFHLDRFVARADFSGATLADLYELTGLALPGTPPYRISGFLTRAGALYTFASLEGVVGSSDLHGDISVNASGPKALMRGHLVSRTLDFQDLGALFGGGSAMVASHYLLPDATLHTERLRQMNAEVDYSADTIRSHDFPLRELATDISLENDVLTLKPLAFTFTEGRLSGSLSIDAHNDVPVSSVDARVSNLHIEHFIPGSEKPIEGELEARAQLTGRGASVHQAAASANGALTAVIPAGRIRRSLAEWLGVNVVSALGLTLAGDESDTGIRCAVLHFDAKDGLLTAQQLVLDTDPVLVAGHGSVDLRNETMDLTLAGKPKTFQFVRLRVPVEISGPLDKPKPSLNAGSALAQAGLATALGFLAPPVAILAFIDPGLAKNANCSGLLTTARTQGAPVKPAAIRASR